MKILASDLDGTLVKDQAISDEDIIAIKRLKEKGHKFVVSTGRTYHGFRLIFDKYDVECDYLVLCNGSIVMDSDHNILYRNYIKSEIALEMITEFLDNDDLCLYFDDGQDTYIVEGHYIEEKEVNIGEYASKIITREDVDDMDRKYQIISVFPKNKSAEDAERIREKLQKKYGEHLEIFRNQFFLDIAPKGCSKGMGLKKIIDNVDEDFGDLHAIGDFLNDLSRFEVTNNRYTFHHAEEIVKGSANNHVNHVHECICDILNINS